MTNYSFFNLVAAVPAIILVLKLRKIRKLKKVFAISLAAPIFAYPWLFFGIMQQAWSHGDPGPRFLGVPLNEILLAYIMTFINVAVLTISHGSILQEAGRGSKAKDSTRQQKKDNPV